MAWEICEIMIKNVVLKRVIAMNDIMSLGVLQMSIENQNVI